MFPDTYLDGSHVIEILSILDGVMAKAKYHRRRSS
jgi:hypothetical protein